MNEKIKAVVDSVYEGKLTAAELMEVVRVAEAFRQKGIGPDIFEDYDIEFLVNGVGLASDDIVPYVLELQQSEMRRCLIRI